VRRRLEKQIKPNVLQGKSSRRDRRCHSRAQRVIAVITTVVVIRAGEAGCGHQVADTARAAVGSRLGWNGRGSDGMGWDVVVDVAVALLTGTALSRKERCETQWRKA
jgi:hypothetical protein